jgi:hypothetical protein
MSAQSYLGVSQEKKSRISDYLPRLSETLQQDYRAVVINEIPPSEQATERGVNVSTICTNVSRAAQKLTEHWRKDNIAVPASEDESKGYNIEIVPVGGSNSDGTPSAIGKFTFETDQVRDRVCNHLRGDVLNACAGETILPHDCHRNDINSDRPALDSSYDVTDGISEKLEKRSYDACVFDPPFDSTNADRHYEGWHVSDICAARDELAELVAPGGLLIECGWSSHSVSSWEGWEPVQLYLFQRGPTIPDMFMTVDVKVQQTLI